MAATTLIKTTNYNSSQTWRVTETKEWRSGARSTPWIVKTEEENFVEIPSIKWQASLALLCDDLSFSVEVHRQRLETERLCAIRCKVTCGILTGKSSNDRQLWLSWDLEEKNLTRKVLFSKEIGDFVAFKNKLNSEDFELLITVSLTKTQVETVYEETPCEVDSRTKLIDTLKGLLTTSDYSDITIKTQDREHKLHKAILAARSKFFNSYFAKHPDATHFDIGLGNVSEKVFANFVNFLYTAECEIFEDEGELIKTFSLADVYEVPDLKQIYECILETRVTETNAQNMFLAALKYHSEHGLKRRSFDFIQKHYKNMGVNLPSKLAEKTLDQIREYISEEIRVLEMAMQVEKKLHVNEE